MEAAEGEAKIEYRVWNPFRSKIAAAILGGVDNVHIKPGSKVLYLGAAAGTTVSHVADVVGPEGAVYAVEFSHRPGRDLVNMAKKRTNVIPIIEDARHPQKYRMLVGMVRHHSFYTSQSVWCPLLVSNQAAFSPSLSPLSPLSPL